MCGVSARSHNFRNVYIRHRTGVATRDDMQHTVQLTILRAGRSEVRFPARTQDFCFSLKRSVRPSVAPTQPHIQWGQGVEAKGKTDPSHLSRTEVKNGRSYATASPIHLHVVHRGTGPHPNFGLFSD